MSEARETAAMAPSPARAGEGVRAARGVACALALTASAAAFAGPVLVYREGDAWCPRDRPANAPRITAAQAIERAKALLPPGFCGPNWYVSGCEYDPEWAHDTWRVFAQQYHETGGRRERGGRDHTYVVLDAVGNCIVNIPGT